MVSLISVLNLTNHRKTEPWWFRHISSCRCLANSFNLGQPLFEPRDLHVTSLLDLVGVRWMLSPTNLFFSYLRKHNLFYFVFFFNLLLTNKLLWNCLLMGSLTTTLYNNTVIHILSMYSMQVNRGSFTV